MRVLMFRRLEVQPHLSPALNSVTSIIHRVVNLYTDLRNDHLPKQPANHQLLKTELLFDTDKHKGDEAIPLLLWKLKISYRIRKSHWTTGLFPSNFLTDIM